MKATPLLKISISGVRGVIGESLTPLLLTHFASAFGTYTNSGKILIGRDTRPSGEMVKSAVICGLLSSGCEVLDVDICPVPTIQVATEHYNCDGGIAITASHNPVEWNALKFIRDDGIYLNQYQAEELLDIYHQGEYKKVESSQIKKVKRIEEAVNIHLQKIFNIVDIDLIRAKKFRVVIDTCNGAGSVVTPQMLKKLGCEVIPLNVKPDGVFPHNPEPLPENLVGLCQKVRESGADIGFAQDADADRLGLVTNEGIAVSEEYTLALAVDFYLQKKKGKVVINLSTSRLIEDIAQKYDCEVIRTKIGEVNVVEKMKKVDAVIGGEGGGGVILPEVHYGRDSFVGIALILNYLAESSKKIQDLINGMPKYHQEKKKIPISSDKVPIILKRLHQVYRKENLDLTEGVKINFSSSWVHIRPSNTEPIMRIVTEAKTKKEAEKLSKKFIKEIKRAV